MTDTRHKPTIVTTGPAWLTYPLGILGILVAVFLPVLLAIAVSGWGLGWLVWLFGV